MKEELMLEGMEGNTMICTVTLNPALDRLIVVEQLVVKETILNPKRRSKICRI